MLRDRIKLAWVQLHHVFVFDVVRLVDEFLQGGYTDYLYAHTTENGSTVSWKVWNVSADPGQSAVFTKAVTYPSSVSIDGHAESVVENAYTTSLGDFAPQILMYANRAASATLGWKTYSSLSASGDTYNIGPLYEGGVVKAVAWTIDSASDFPVICCQTSPPQC